MEDIRGQVLGRVAIAYAPRDIAVHSREIQLVQFGKAAGVFLGRLRPADGRLPRGSRTLPAGGLFAAGLLTAIAPLTI